MHLKIRFLLLVCGFILCSFPNSSAVAGGFDWWSAASAGVKAYKAMTISDDDVVAYVRQTVKHMDASNNVLSASNPYSVRLSKIVAGITKVNGVKLNFKVYKTSEVNAFACADGSVRIYSGLMDLMTDEEILGVIGHEIGHVGLHHSRKAIKKELMTGALRDAIISTDGRWAALAASQLGALGEVLVNAKYSRSQEQEADDFAYNFLKKNRKNPRALVKALDKLKNLEGKSSSISSYVSRMFSSHPDTDKRISHLKSRLRKDGL